MIGLYVVLGLLVLLVVAVVISYNRFVRQVNLVRASWRQVDVELRRRRDLIPNLIETVKGYAAHERGVFEAVTEARVRATAASPEDVAGTARGEESLIGSLRRLFAVAEDYPALRADANFRLLQDQLAETEDRIAAARRFYNGNVRALNTRVEAFPSNLVAAGFRFHRAVYFEVAETAVRAPVTVDFGQDSGTPPTP